jgi:hypothetical protein
MATLTRGTTYGATETITNTKLHILVDNGSVSGIVNGDVSASANIVDTKLNTISTAGKVHGSALSNLDEIPSGGGIIPAVNLSSVYPVGSIYINAAVDTNPATLLGFGTWSAFGAGKVMVGLDSGDTDFDTLEETGGAKSVTLTGAQSGTSVHTHALPYGGSDSGGGTGGYVEPPYNTATYGGTSGQNIPNSSAANASEAHTNLQPYIVVYMWKRTA